MRRTAVAVVTVFLSAGVLTGCNANSAGDKGAAKPSRSIVRHQITACKLGRQSVVALERLSKPKYRRLDRDARRAVRTALTDLHAYATLPASTDSGVRSAKRLHRSLIALQDSNTASADDGTTTAKVTHYLEAGSAFLDAVNHDCRAKR